MGDCKDSQSHSVLDNAVPSDDVTTWIRRIAFSTLLTARTLRFSQLVSETGLDASVVRSTLAKLLAGGVATIMGDLAGDPEIVGAEGVTVLKTAHRLKLNGATLFTWCAFDIVGIPAALGLNAFGETVCPTCTRAILLEMEQGVPKSGPAAGWWPLDTAGPVVETFCPTASIFCNSSHLERWQTKAGAHGEILTLDQLAERGAQTWRRFVP